MSTKRIWFYDSVYGQGCVLADGYEEARKEAVKNAGRYADVANVHIASDDEIAFRKAMGGSVE